jgi:hypothetical protein
MVARLAALRRTAITEIAAGRVRVWTLEMGVEAAMPCFMADTMIAFLCRRVPGKEKPKDNERKDAANKKIHGRPPVWKASTVGRHGRDPFKLTGESSTR